MKVRDVLKRIKEDMKNYLVIYEPGKNNWSAFCPDVPGCVAAGRTRMETERLMSEALLLHLRGQEEDGESVSEPSGIEAGYVRVDFEAHSEIRLERDAVTMS